MINRQSKCVTVIGGGFSGAIFAHHLLRTSPVPVVVNLVEEQERLGAGVAYSAAQPHQTTNIPARRMSVYVEDPSHFERWLAAREQSASDLPDCYPNRYLFGTYMDELTRATQPAHPDSALRHSRARVKCVIRDRAVLEARAQDGSTWRADAVALATGNPVPLLLPPLRRLAADSRVILDPWAPGALAALGRNDRVLVVGIGLSMGEAVAGLRAAGHCGEITAIARRGRRPERGMVAAPTPFGEFEVRRPGTATALLRHFRAEVRRAEAAGLSWRSVVMAVRVYGWEIWSSLQSSEKRRFVRHLRPFWEALRHVMPGQVHDELAKEERNGRLRVLAASLRELEAAPDGLYASLHRRGASQDDVQRERFDVVLNCTGPAYASLTETDPFWAGLAQSGLIQADEIGLGIAVDWNGCALDWQGTQQPDLLVLGTLARGTFGELTGVAELSRQAKVAANALIRVWN